MSAADQMWEAKIEDLLARLNQLRAEHAKANITILLRWDPHTGQEKPLDIRVQLYV